MYSMSHPASALSNGGLGNGMMDGSGTINPAALNSSGVLTGPHQTVAPQASPRGVKRSRSPDTYGDVPSSDRGDEDESKPRKRGRPPKMKVSESPRSSTQPPPTPSQPAPAPVQTPQLKNTSLPQTSPTQASPPKSTPTKGTVIKALPTVRDHTTDQLNPEGDEYIPREYDDAGEKKATTTGHPLDGREYRCRTFFVPNRGDKLFMLATECARVLGYRDSYLLFNKNRSLYKIIATQAEKDDLIHQEILPYSYRSRQIAIVTARSMFRQFGSRLIVNGRRVRDDYWESKARKQGFTEEDAAGEKRPRAAKAREAAAAEASHAHSLTSLPHGEIIYSNGPTNPDHRIGGINPATLAPLPMINLAPMDDLRLRDYSSEILNQAAQIAEFNKALGAQRSSRERYLNDYWKRPYEASVTSSQRQGTVDGGINQISNFSLNVPSSLPSLPYVHAEPSNRHKPKADEGSEVMTFEPDRQNWKEIDVDSKEILRKPVPSDSGYRSGLGTDTESVCSMGSVGTSLGLTQDFLQEFTAFFGDMLIDKAGVRAWAGYALAKHTPEDIEQRLNGLLKDYTVELLSATEALQRAAVQHTTPNQGGGTDNRIASGAIKLICRCRPKIARYFRDNVVSAPLTSMSMTARLQELSRQLSRTGKLDLFGRLAPSRRGPDEAINNMQPEGDIEDNANDGEYLDNLTWIRDFLMSGEAFQNLATAMRRSLYCDDRTGMDEIRRQVLEVLSEAANLTYCPNCSDSQNDRKRCSNHQSFYSARFNVAWGLRGFLQSQFGNRAPRIGSLVALTGSALYAQATTCFDYLQTTWPRSGAFFLSTLQTAVDSGGNLDNQKNGNSTASTEGLNLNIAFLKGSSEDDASVGSVVIDAHGSDQMLVELAQQLAWTGAVLSSSPYGEKLAYSQAVIQSVVPGHLFTIKFQSETLHPTEDPCWLPLFCGASITRGFPIPPRQNEMGLEIPLEIMAGIAGVRHAVEYEGGVIMKGFSNMFVPIKRSGNRVQWHLVSSPNCETRLSYRDVLDRWQTRASLKEVNLESLRTTRAIVGWCSTVGSLLGSNTADYENIDYSGAEDADSPLKFSGGTLGFQQFGVAQLDFTLGPKDGKCHFQRSGPYKRILAAAEKAPIVLYDTAENRAWLMPASSVMLHVAHHRNWLEPCEVDGKRIKLLSTGPNGPSAKEALLKNASIELSDCEQYTFKDMVIDIWSLLEFLIDQNVRRDRTSGATVKGTLRDVVQGFEFKAVVEERSPFRQKQTVIKKTSGGWPTLTRDIDALVLFANGYGDVLRPLKNNNQGLCNSWQSVPKWNDYLATTVKTLKDLFDVAGCRLNQTYLTSTHLQWHRGNSSLFEPCKMPGEYKCQCDRLQQIVPKSAVGRIVPPGILIDDGAVIFGRSGSLFQGLLLAPQLQESNSIYSQPNVGLTPVTVRQDPDETLSACLDSKPSAWSGSDATDSALSSFTPYTSQESVAANVVDLNLDADGTPYAKKRCWAPYDSVRVQQAPQQDIFSPQPSKRARRGQNLDAEGFQHQQTYISVAWPKGSSLKSVDIMDHSTIIQRESRQALHIRDDKRSQRDSEKVFKSTADDAYGCSLSSREADLSDATEEDQYPECSITSTSLCSDNLSFRSPSQRFESANKARLLRRQRNFTRNSNAGASAG